MNDAIRNRIQKAVTMMTDGDDSLIYKSRHYVESCMEDLEGQQDVEPFLICRNRDDKVIFTHIMDMPDTVDESDFVSAVVSFNRAVEVVLGCAAWVIGRDDLNCQDVPSEQPDRIETMLLHHVTPDGDAIYCAKVTREDNRVQIGSWASLKSPCGGGALFLRAIHRGMHFATTLPPGLVEVFETTDEPRKMLTALANAFGAMRAITNSAITN